MNVLNEQMGAGRKIPPAHLSSYSTNLRRTTLQVSCHISDLKIANTLATVLSEFDAAARVEATHSAPAEILTAILPKDAVAVMSRDYYGRTKSC